MMPASWAGPQHAYDARELRFGQPAGAAYSGERANPVPPIRAAGSVLIRETQSGSRWAQGTPVYFFHEHHPDATA